MLYLSRRTKSKELGILRKDEKKKAREIGKKAREKERIIGICIFLDFLVLLSLDYGTEKK